MFLEMTVEVGSFAPTGARVEELELVEPYSDDYNEVLDEAQEDLNNDIHREIRTKIENMED